MLYILYIFYIFYIFHYFNFFRWKAFMDKTELALSVLIAILGSGCFFTFLQFLIIKKIEKKGN